MTPKKVNISLWGHIGYDQQVLPNPLKSAKCDSNILVSEVILKWLTGSSVTVTHNSISPYLTALAELS